MADFTFLRRAIDLAFPKGPPFEPDIDGDMSALRDGDADNFEDIRADVKNLKYIRNPTLTPVFGDLKREYGITLQDTLSEADQRELMKPEVYKRSTTGSTGDLQARLDNAGFNLTVYDNSPDGPAVDPAIIIDQVYQMQAAGGNHYAGRTDAYAGQLGGYWLVNGRQLLDQGPAYFGAGMIYAGNTTAVAGYYESYKYEEKIYPTPTDPDSWPFCFFVGAPGADINPVTGALISIPQGSVSSNLRQQLERIVLKFKPLYTWAGMIITYN